MLAWLTKNSLPSASAEYVIRLPVDVDWQADFFGALVPLMDARNWEQFETLSPDQMADTWREILLEQLWNLKMPLPIGTIITFAGADFPADYIPCDGSSYLRSEFQALFDVIGTVYGSVDATHFNVPNLLGRFILGETVAHPAGQTGGAETHTLNIAQMPAHRHNSFEGTSSFLLVQAGSGTIGTSPGTLISGNAATAVAGSGQSHNNMPPFLSIYTLIKYR